MLPLALVLPLLVHGSISGTSAGTRTQPYHPLVKTEVDQVGDHLVTSTFLGGSDSEIPQTVWANERGTVFYLGTTNSPDFPLKNPLLATAPPKEYGTFLTCFSPTGEVVFSTLLNTRGFVFGFEGKFDPTGNFYLTGTAERSDFVVTNPVNNLKQNAGMDVFLLKFSAEGTFLFSTLLGGTDGIEENPQMLVGADGSVVVTGETSALNFPLKKAFQKDLNNRFPPPPSRWSDIFVTKFDPVGKVVFSTYLGGLGTENLFGAQLDEEGNIYVCAEVQSNFPTRNAFQTEPPSLLNQRTAITKFNPKGKVVYSTYLGGEFYDRPKGFQVSPGGRAVVAVETGSRKLPTVNSFQNSPGEGMDTYLASFDSNGRPQFTTYVGGGAEDSPKFFHVDAEGNTYVTGLTTSTNFPTVRAFQTQLKGMVNFFITKVTPAGTVAFSTYLGGSIYQVANVSFDRQGNLYFVGTTASVDFPFVKPFPVPSSGYQPFITKVSNQGEIVYSTLFPAVGSVTLDNAVVDLEGNFYANGYAGQFLKLMTVNAFQPKPGGEMGGADAFVTKINSQGELVFSTHLGGSLSEGSQNNSLLIGPQGEIWVSGETESVDFPMVNPIQSVPSDAGQSGRANQFLTRFSPDGKVLFSTYLGGGKSDRFKLSKINGNGQIYVTGVAYSPDCETYHPFQNVLKGPVDAFLAVLQ